MKKVLSITAVCILLLVSCLIPASAENGYSYTPPSWATSSGGNIWVSPDSSTNINIQITGNPNHETYADYFGANKDVYYNQITQAIASVYSRSLNISEDDIQFSDFAAEKFAGYNALTLKITTSLFFQYEVMFFTDENIYTVVFTTSENSGYSVSEFKDSLESFSIDGYPADEEITEELPEEIVVEAEISEETSHAEKSAKKNKDADKSDDEKDIMPIIIIAAAAVVIVLIVAATIIIVSNNKKKAADVQNVQQPPYQQGNPYYPQQPQYPPQNGQAPYQQPPQNNPNNPWGNNNQQ